MKISKLLTAALAATTLLAACAKEDGGNTNSPVGDDRTVKIRIDRTSPADTRAEGPQVDDDTDVTFNSGHLLFTSQSNAVTWTVAVAKGSTAYNEAAKTVGIEALKLGALITAVPGNSKKVYFIGNAPAGLTPAIGDDISSYSATVLSQYSDGTTDRTPKGGVANVTLFGGDDLTLVSEGEADEYEATFNVTPIAARFEIEAITGQHSDGTSVFEYNVAGIFIDNYYNTSTLAGTGSELKNNGSDADLFATGAGSYTITNGSVFDYNASGIADEDTFSPASGVWAYNLLAPTAGTPQMPAIVIKLTDVKVGAMDYGTQFLTINKFFTEKGGDQALEQLAQGKIYVLDNIEFTEDDLTETPFVKTLKVTVTVTMLPWESSEIGWEL